MDGSICKSEGNSNYFFFEVEDIVTSEEDQHYGHKFLIRWKNKSPSKDTWLTLEDLQKIAPNLAEDYMDFNSPELSSFGHKGTDVSLKGPITWSRSKEKDGPMIRSRSKERRHEDQKLVFLWRAKTKEWDSSQDFNYLVKLLC